MMGTRWKGKGSKELALSEPMSAIVSKLQSSLLQFNSSGYLVDEVVLVEVGPDEADLLNRSCFGQPMVTAVKERQLFHLGLEEAFYLNYALNCLPIFGAENCVKDTVELWQYMIGKRSMFPTFYKVYSHFRQKNWVVRPGIQYGADYVMYRHHPALVHSEYALLIQREDDDFGRLRVWSDWHCMTRLCGGVAKTLLIVKVTGGGLVQSSPKDLQKWTVEECTVRRWIPEQHRADKSLDKDNFARVLKECETSNKGFEALY